MQDDGNTDLVCERGTYPCNDPLGLYIIEVGGATYLYAPGGGPAGPPRSFYYPFVGLTGSPDLGIAVIRQSGQTSVKARRGQPIGDFSSLSYYENALPNGFVLPYDSQTAGEQGGDGFAPFFFLTRVTGLLARNANCSLCVPATTFQFAPEGDVRLPTAVPFQWDIPGVTLLFGPNSRLIVNRPLSVNGGTLTASNASQGWGGVRVTGGTATFANQSTIQSAGVTVTGGTLTLNNSFILNAPSNGIYATGSSSHITVTNQSQINQSGGAGIRAENGATALVNDRSEIVNGWRGVRTSFPNSRITLADGSRVTGASQDAALSIYYGDVLITGSPVTLRDNGLGIRADLIASFGTDNNAPHRFIDNNSGGASGYDVFGIDFSYIDADHSYWGPNVFSSADLVVVEADATILIDPVLTTDPGVGLRSATPSEQAPKSGPFVSALGTDTAQGWIETAEEAAAAGEGANAVAAIERALGATKTTSERRKAWSAAARLSVRLHAPESRLEASATVRLEAVATGALHNADDAPWALRVLALGAAVNPAEHGRAREYTAALLALPNSAQADALSTAGTWRRASLSHAAFAHLLETQMALDDGDEAGALRAVAALAGIDAEQAALAAESVAARFPDAPVESALASLRRASRGAEFEAAVANVSTRLAVSPNPAAGEARLTYAVDAPADVTLAVYDALGRTVATSRTAREAGAFAERVDVSSLPAGVYVARLVVQPSDGSVTTETVRFTVVR